MLVRILGRLVLPALAGALVLNPVFARPAEPLGPGSAAEPVPPAALQRMREVPGDPPFVAARPHQTSPPAQVRVGPFTHVQVNVARNGDNILGDAANEPSIAVDPTNPNRIAIGWRQFDDVLSNFRQAGYAYSQDAGRTWRFPGALEPGVFRSDPVLGFAADGTFYFSSLASSPEGNPCDLFISPNRGVWWDGPFDAWGGDKQWVCVDRTTGVGRGNIYSAWALALACCGTNTFTRSLDGGITFQLPVGIVSNPQWGSMDVGPDGAVYVAGITRSDAAHILVAKSASAKASQSMPLFESASSVDLGGSMRVGGGPNPDGLLGQAWVAVDPSSGPTAGYLYLLCSVDPPGADPMDVQFARSTDGGQTWSAPVRVNDVATGWQWFGTMSVAPNGRIDAVWNDTRNTGAANLSELYYSSSSNGGVTWSENLRLSPAWDSSVGWPNQFKIGDYYHMISDRVGADLAWAATLNGEQDVWFVRIGDYDCNGNGVGDTADIVFHLSTDWNQNRIPDECEGLHVSDAAPAPARTQLFQNVPNPFNPTTSIAFELPAGGPMRLEILDIAGRIVRTLDGFAPAGRSSVVWDGADSSGRPLGSGVYVYRLTSPGGTAARRMVLVR